MKVSVPKISLLAGVLVLGGFLLWWLMQTPKYYVSNTGDDANSGTSPGRAWRTISKANSFTFKPGEELLFEGGQTFTGTIQLTAADSGSVEKPIVISSYGAGRATIDGGAGSGLIIEDTKNINVRNLRFTGLGRKTGSKAGVGVAIINASSIIVDQVETTGFQRAGVHAHNSANVRLTRVYAHENGFAGIYASQVADAYIGHCRAIRNLGDPTITDNHSGNGIVVSGSKILIEYCEAAENGADMQQVNTNGPVGIWCYDADRVLIQYCISHHNTSPADDGGGFDFDGGVTRSMMQYNYAYDNKNYGYLAWDYGSMRKWEGNTIRYNISVNNTGPGLLLGGKNGGSVTYCEVYNNLFYNNIHPAIVQVGDANNFNFRNNILVGPSTSSLVATGEGLRYQGNNYWFLDKGFNLGGYHSLAAWVEASGQEKVEGRLVGLHANPQLRSPAAYEKLTDPTKLPTLMAFLVPPDSPVINAGLDLNSLFGIGVPAHDFYGTSLSAGSGASIGVQHVMSSNVPARPDSGE